MMSELRLNTGMLCNRMRTVDLRQYDGKRSFIMFGETGHEIHYEDYIKLLVLFGTLEENRAHWGDFPQSDVEVKDEFEVMNKAKYQMSFFNGYLVTKSEFNMIRRAILDAINKFNDIELAVFGGFPGTMVGALMEDGGLINLSIR